MKSCWSGLIQTGRCSRDGGPLFCGILLSDNEAIRDNSFVSKVRSYLADHVDMVAVQKVLLARWKDEIPDKHAVFMDATCYEVSIRFPTDVKLLWECCQWLWEKQIPDLCKRAGIKQPRSKYKEQKKKTNAYNKVRKKSYRKTRTRRNALLKLLLKGIQAYQYLLDQVKARYLSPKDAANKRSKPFIGSRNTTTTSQKRKSKIESSVSISRISGRLSGAKRINRWSSGLKSTRYKWGV